MSNRLWSDLSPSSGRRYWSGLISVPGIVSPAPAVLTLVGQIPVASQNIQIFRTPATAVLTLQGLALGAPVVLIPAAAALSINGLIPSELRSLTITPAMPAPDYSAGQDTPPTLITIMTVIPAAAQLVLSTPPINVTQGGNIGFVSPGVGLVSIGGQVPTLIYEIVGLGQINITGHAPTLQLGLTIQPEAALIYVGALAPRLTLPFIWIDDDPVPPTTWIRDAAA